MGDEELLTVGDLSKLAGVVSAKARRWIDDGLVPSRRTKLGIRLVLRRDADRLLRERAKAKTKPAA